jgi:CPA2 family monovalent cation:H+ antiporter-2
MIQRDDYQIAAPGRDQMIFPNDTLLVLGTDHQIQRLKVLIKPETKVIQQHPDEVALYDYYVSENNELRGRSIRESGLREKANAIVVGIERNDERILNPGSDTTLLANDILFIVGNPKMIKDFLSRFK